MGACGCVEINFRWKINARDGSVWLLGVYPGCNYCDAPAGIQYMKVKPEDKHFYPEVDFLEELETWDDGLGFIPIVDHKVVKQKIKTMLLGYKPDNGALDEIDCDVLADEIMPDMRDVVFDTMKENMR